MTSQKVLFPVFLSFRRKRTNVVRWPESSKFNLFWMPDQVRHDDSWTSHKTIKIDGFAKSLQTGRASEEAPCFRMGLLHS